MPPRCPRKIQRLREAEQKKAEAAVAAVPAASAPVSATKNRPRDRSAEPPRMARHLVHRSLPAVLVQNDLCTRLECQDGKIRWYER